jgi:hypothetical protein
MPRVKPPRPPASQNQCTCPNTQHNTTALTTPPLHHLLQVRLGYRPSGSLNQAPTFIAAADDQRSSGRLTAYYQSCTGTYVYQIDAVLMPCNFVNLVPLVKEGEDVQGFSSGNFTEDTLGDTFSSSPPVVAFNRTRRTNGAAHDTTSCIKNWVAAAAALAAGAGIML